MNDNSVQQREHWGSRIGFILAAAGSAIGLGNIWRFPYLVGKNGGAAFVLVYLIITVFIGLPVVLVEFAVGRAAQKAPVAAFSAIGAHPFWSLIGWLGTIAGGFLTLSFYNVVGGWTIKYMIESLGVLMPVAASGGTSEFFGAFVGYSWQVVLFQAVFMILTMLIVLGGIGKGIERACKVMMPTLFVILLVLIVRSVTLPGAEAGIEFYLKPDFSKLTGATMLDALGQSFFSLSLGLGVMITYGSYLGREERIPSAAVWTASLDTLVALLAGLAIFPAVFAMGLEPAQGAGLSFVTLPAVFAKMPAGMLFSFLFFLLLFFAAVTSSMSLMEVATAFAMERFGLKRSKAAISMGIIILLLGVPSALSLSGSPAIHGKIFFDAVEYVCNNILLPLGSLLACIFVGWIWLDKACSELTNEGKISFGLMKAWIWCVRILSPLAILYIFATGLKW
ncbi:MAG: sodium-dependent transporter [Synergistaceae bacterium]|nr:sodium-dependent transporter [Synergistaceae bacterium]